MPRQETKTRTLYQFEELGPEAKEKAINNHRDVNIHEDWYACALDGWKDALAYLGFTGPEIQFSGFWSQGDGASFTSAFDASIYFTRRGDVLRVCELIKRHAHDEIEAHGRWYEGVDAELLACAYVVAHAMEQHGLTLPEPIRYPSALAGEVSGNVSRTSHHYVHENSCRFECHVRDIIDGTRVGALVDEFEEDIEEFRRALCQCVYFDLETEYEYLTNEKSVAETLEASAYEFTFDGDDA